jgi:hypothetical protein
MITISASLPTSTLQPRRYERKWFTCERIGDNPCNGILRIDCNSEQTQEEIQYRNLF